MATVPLGTHFHHCCRLESPKIRINSRNSKRSHLYYSRKGSFMVKNGAKFHKFRPSFDCWVLSTTVRASSNSSTSDTAVLDPPLSDDVISGETFPLQRIEKVEGKILIRLDSGKDEENWQLTIGCNLPGKWVLHWGVNYENDIDSEWDQPPAEMIPPDSITIKDYAIETPLTKSSTVTETDSIHEVKIDFNTKSSIAAINFVLKDAETGSWYQYRGRDFKVPLVDFSYANENAVGTKQGFAIWPGTSGELSGVMVQSENSVSEDENRSCKLKEFCEEHSIVKETLVEHSMNVYIKKGSDASNNVLHMETDIPGDIIVHWGICKDESLKWEIPSEPHPDNTSVFKNKALRTQLQHGCTGVFPLDEETSGFLFVLKLKDTNTWINNMGNDFYIRIPKESVSQNPENNNDEEAVSGAYTDEIIDEIRHLVTGISSAANRKTKSKEKQEIILQEIEKLAAEAYSIYRSSVQSLPQEIDEFEAVDVDVEPPVKVSSATGSGFEILFQGFNWESNKSGRWYGELQEKVEELASLGFTVVWLPPPTESISPEGYMPRDLYNLNSSYKEYE